MTDLYTLSQLVTRRIKRGRPSEAASSSLKLPLDDQTHHYVTLHIQPRAATRKHEPLKNTAHVQSRFAPNFIYTDFLHFEIASTFQNP